jgi:hypothetical protein
MKAIISTYKRHDLAAVAVDAVRRLATGIDSVVVLDGSGTMASCPGADEVRHVRFAVRAGCFAAIRAFPGEPLLCIDDDVVLVRPVDMARYTAGMSKPLNGQMVLVVRPGAAGHERLPNVRIQSPRDVPWADWSTAAARHRCELVDNVWLHVDRGSEGENAAREAVVASLVGTGPGTQLKRLLSRLGIAASPTCSCNKRAQVMDEKGCDWCAEHIDEIDGWLAEEAKKRKLPYLSLAGKTLIRLAIRRARKKDNSR